MKTFKMPPLHGLHHNATWTMRILLGRLFLNGVEYRHVIDRGRMEYTLATTLPDTAELRRVVSDAFAAGEINAIRTVRERAKARRGKA